MATSVSIAFRRACKVYDFDSGDVQFAIGDRAVVKTSRGTELGEVVAVQDVDSASDLKKVVRKANADDLECLEQSRIKEADARKLVRRRIADKKLEMKLVDVEYVFDATKAVVYFTAEERVDFRELVDELADELKTRVDMRQIGVRDEAKMIGGLGPCGQQLCCSRFARDFDPVSIRMAKEQDLPLNPQKISGACGRLMCCLRYEYETYKDFKKEAPKRGKTVDTARGPGKIVDFKVPTGQVVLRMEDGGPNLVLTLTELEKGILPEGAAPAPLAAAPRKEKPRSEGKKRGGDQGKRGRGKSRQGKGGQGRDSRQRDGQKKDGQKKDGQKKDGQKKGKGSRKRSGQKRSGQKGQGQRREGERQEGQAKPKVAEGTSVKRRRRRRKRRPAEGGKGGSDGGAGSGGGGSQKGD